MHEYAMHVGMHCPVQVDRDANLVNAYVSPTRPGRVELENLGNLASIKRIPIEGIADIELKEDGKVMWAFSDDSEPLAINPLALVQKDAEVCIYFTVADVCFCMWAGRCTFSQICRCSNPS